MTYMIGVMFWGLVATTIFLTLAVTVGVFLHVAYITSLSTYIGLCITLLFKNGCVRGFL